MTDFDWSLYLNQAFALVQSSTPDNPEEEAQRRTSISRGYDALHNIAREYAAEHLSFSQGVELDGSAHGKLISLLQKSDGKMKDVGKLLFDLRHLRNKADYDPAPLRESPKEIESLLLRTKRAVDLIRAERKRLATRKP